MKKNYKKLKFITITVMLMVLVIGCCSLTYEKAVFIQEECRREIFDSRDKMNSMRWNMAISEDYDDIEKQAYYILSQISRSNDIGFYSMLKDEAGNTLVEEQNFIIISKYSENYDPQSADKRIILLGDDFVTDDEYEQVSFALNSFSSVEIKGLCDDKYIYLDELKWVLSAEEVQQVYKPEMKAPSSDNIVSFESWAGGNKFNEEDFQANTFGVTAHTSYPIYGDWEKNKKLNKEAKEMCEKVYEAYEDGWNIINYQKIDGLLTTYIMDTGYINDNYAMPYVYVFHPLGLAMEQLLPVYVMVGVFAIGFILFIWFMVDGVYKKQLAYENNRRQLTRGIAHELKTPLAITKGYLENWEYLGETERQESSKTMLAEITHMDRMVTDLLELSHLEAKMKKLNIESVDIHALARSVVSHMKPIIDERKLTISGNVFDENIDDGIYLVEADLEMLRVVLVNFISNAVKYAKEEVTINLIENGKKVRFIVINDGQTIAPDKISKVWDEFYRDEVVDAKRIGGSGLGLAIAKNILMLHGAKYGCMSQEGKTAFGFEMKK